MQSRMRRFLMLGIDKNVVAEGVQFSGGGVIVAGLATPSRDFTQEQLMRTFVSMETLHADMIEHWDITSRPTIQWIDEEK